MTRERRDWPGVLHVNPDRTLIGRPGVRISGFDEVQLHLTSVRRRELHTAQKHMRPMDSAAVERVRMGFLPVRRSQAEWAL
jgi:hypothetical protein